MKASLIALVIVSIVRVGSTHANDGTMVPELAQRLSSLDGRIAMPYFLLAEEVAAEVPGERGVALARTLFVLAHEIDRESPRPAGLGPSVYLALASIAERDGEREWLYALAGRGGLRPSGSMRVRTDSIEPSGALIVAEAIGAARAGEGREVKEHLTKPDAQPALGRLRNSSKSVFGVLEDAQRNSSCPICRNRRTMKSLVPREGGGNDEVHTLCPECRGNPGPRLTVDQFAKTLDAETMLLGASHTQWSAQVWLDGGAPFADPDPDDLASLYGVDVGARIWRPQPDAADELSGRWIAPSSD